MAQELDIKVDGENGEVVEDDDVMVVISDEGQWEIDQEGGIGRRP